MLKRKKGEEPFGFPPPEYVFTAQAREIEIKEDAVDVEDIKHLRFQTAADDLIPEIGGGEGESRRG